MSQARYYSKKVNEKRIKHFLQKKNYTQAKKTFLSDIESSTQLEDMKKIQFGGDPFGIERKKHQERLSYLGNISESPKLYFNKTKETAEDASAFLDEFFRKHATKLVSQHEEHKAQPGCISFTSLRLKSRGTNICLVTKSCSRIDVDSEIIDTVNTLNSYGRTHFVWIPYTDIINDFLAMVNKELGIHIPSITKPCSEKALLSVMFDLFAKYGDDIQIRGMINCTFYPFPNSMAPSTFTEQTGIDEFKNFQGTSGIADQFYESAQFKLDKLAKDYRTHAIDACFCCQKYKDSALFILSWAQVHNKRIAEVAPSGFSLPCQDGLFDFNTLGREDKRSFNVDFQGRENNGRQSPLFFQKDMRGLVDVRDLNRGDSKHAHEKDVRGLIDIRDLNRGDSKRSHEKDPTDLIDVRDLDLAHYYRNILQLSQAPGADPYRINHEVRAEESDKGRKKKRKSFSQKSSELPRSQDENYKKQKSNNPYSGRVFSQPKIPEKTLQERHSSSSRSHEERVRIKH